MTRPAANHLKAQRHLAKSDPVLQRIIKLVGPCTLWQNPDRFRMLVRSIVSQQISGKAAEAISGRLEKRLRRSGIKPRAILRLTDEDLRTIGVSSGKARSLRDLAEKVHAKTVPLDSLHEVTDEEAIEALIPVRGIGRWTAQMFLIFSLGRLDVLPVADYGLRVAIRNHYGLKELPKPGEIEEVAKPWQPYRSIATWYCWRSLGGVPQSD